MLSSNRHVLPRRCSPFLFCKPLVFCLVTFGVPCIALPDSLVNITIPLTSPSLIYTPFVCNATEVSLNPGQCEGAWQMSRDSLQVGVSLTGPPFAPKILPQLFFQFRAPAVFLTTSVKSNATVDITVSGQDFIRSLKFDSSRGMTSISELPYDRTLLFTLTTDPLAPPTSLILTSITISVPSDVILSSTLPDPVIYPPASLPTVQTQQPSEGNASFIHAPNIPSRDMIGQAVGLTVGLGLGLTSLALLLFYSWRWRLNHQDVTKKGSFRQAAPT